ncbi:MAG: TVP38/TMEM64 family protein [Acholeplasmatales bacterium]|nr:TVP38/TMEM64 family protein [Acholeplasmatales bacterium]
MRSNEDLSTLEVDPKKAKRYKIIRIIIEAVVLSVLTGLLIWVLIKYLPYFMELSNNKEKRDVFIQDIKGYGPAAFFIILGLQVFQVIFMIIPSGPIVIASGVVLNPFLAVLVCILGQTLGGIIVYILVKLLGYDFLALFADPNKIKNSKLFGNRTQTEVMMFGYLMIPALPKDIVAFIAPFTKVNLWRFTLINIFARIPMTIVSVMMGTAFIDGNYVLAFVLAGCSGVCALLCFIFNKKIVNFLDRNKKEEVLEVETKEEDK